MNPDSAMLRPHAAARTGLLALALALGGCGSSGAPSPQQVFESPSTIGGATFRVTLDEAAAAAPVSGRLIVLTKSSRAQIPRSTPPIEGPFWSDPQPLFGLDVTGLKPGETVLVNGAAGNGFPFGAWRLEPGTYTAQARLDTARLSSSWRQHDGNLFGPPVTFSVFPGAQSEVPLRLSTATKAPQPPASIEGVQFIDIPSAILSNFRKTDVRLRASVIQPRDFQPGRTYAALYEVPGFGGDHLSGLRQRARQWQGRSDTAANRSPESESFVELSRSAYLILLDPESPNGHTLFADSANNGPCGEALITELIPAIENAAQLSQLREARLLRGHSSGGWSVLWLMLRYPKTFGGAWSSSPDPVDFRALQSVNIYADANMYTAPDGAELPSYIKDGRSLMTIRQENGGEQIVGPDNTSAQQWDSWQAVWGPRTRRSTPAALFDPWSGAIDRAVVSDYARYDIAALFRASPNRYGPILRDQVRIVVGNADEFSLHKACELLKADVDAWIARNPAKDQSFGFITIVPGKTHGSIYDTDEVRGFSRNMLDHLKRSGLY